MKQLFEDIKLPAVLIAAVCLIVLAAHWPVLYTNALSFDDDMYITQNVLVRNPGWASTERFFIEVFNPSTVDGYYQPLTMISLMLDYAAGGRPDNLFAFHLTSLALHAANTALLIVVLYMLFGNIWVAVAVGLLFGVHPMTVETIAWSSERKTLLAAFFAFWSLLFYIRYARTAGKKDYAVCLIAYLLALMSKPTSLPLPFVMLLMDYWPLNRLSRKSIVEKMPLFVLLTVFAVITVLSQLFTGGGSLPGEAEHKLQNVPLIICYDIVFYPLKMLWPAKLSSHYTYPQPFVISNPKLLACVVITAALIILLIVSLRRTKAALAGWLIFFVAILPAMQVFRFSQVIASDKFAYLPSIGLLMIMASFLLWLYKIRPQRTAMISIIVLLLAGAEAVVVRQYLPYWRDTITHYKYMLALAPESVPLRGNLAIAYGQQGRNEEAVELLKEAIAIDPNEGRAYLNLGIAYFKLNEYPQALDALTRAVQLMPYDPDTYLNLAYAYGAIDRFEEQIALCQKAIELVPDSPDAYVTLGSAYSHMGRFSEAIEAYQNAVKILPQDASVRFGLGLAYLKNGDLPSAMRQYEILKTLDTYLADRLLGLINQ